MRLADIIRISQNNLLRSKLRTFLTIAAVFIGSLTLSLTNGVGNGIKEYVDSQLGNLGAENTLIVRAKQESANPINNKVRRYDPNKKTGNFNLAVLGSNDIEKIGGITGITKIIPQYIVQLEYITTGLDKYEITANQYVEGLNLEMIAGRTVGVDSVDEITIPARYIKPGMESDALGKYVAIGYKDSAGKILEKSLRLVGIQQHQSLVGNSGASISSRLAEEIYKQQTAGVASLADSYIAVTAQYDPGLTEDEVLDIKQRLDNAGYQAQTIEDQIGIISSIIDSILIVLNIFGVITLLAAAFGIVNTLLMSVNERTSEIGLMKALGANRKTIFAIFAMEAASIGFWGALLGTLAGIGLGAVGNRIASETFLESFPGFDLLAFPLVPLLGILLGIMLLALAAGTLPSLKASKLDPIKALRYE
jgi:putative ABC transport system permease protein